MPSSNAQPRIAARGMKEDGPALEPSFSQYGIVCVRLIRVLTQTQGVL